MKQQKQRAGETITSSVSISKEFARFIQIYNLSPTECLRKGVAVSLCDLGVESYQSQKNEERLKYTKEFLKNLDEDLKLNADFLKIKKFEKIRAKLDSIKKLIKEIEVKDSNEH